MLNKIMKIATFAALTVVALIEPSFAQQTTADVFTKAAEKGNETFTNIRLIVFLVGGFGLVGLAFAAIFGKVHWRWAAGLGLGLFVLAVAAAVVDFATNRGTMITDGDTV